MYSVIMQIKYSDIPQWLKDSLFYSTFCCDEPDSHIEIPTECYRETCDFVQSIKDVAAILKVIRFWGTMCLPRSVLEFCSSSDAITWDPVFVDIFGEGMPEHKCFLWRRHCLPPGLSLLAIG